MTPEEVEALLVQQAGQIDDLGQTVADLRASRAASADPDTSTDTDTDLPGFVKHVIAPLYATHGSVGWCARWWDHHEARVRLAATWHGWEAAQRDRQGMSRWLREVADMQLNRLRDRDRGPFRACGPNKHLPPPRCLASASMPDGEPATPPRRRRPDPSE